MKKLLIMLVLFSTIETKTLSWTVNGWGGAWITHSILAFIPPITLAFISSCFKKNKTLKNCTIYSLGFSSALALVNLVNLKISEDMISYDDQRAQNINHYYNVLTQIQHQLNAANCTCP